MKSFQELCEAHDVEWSDFQYITTTEDGKTLVEAWLSDADPKKPFLTVEDDWGFEGKIAFRVLIKAVNAPES